MEIALKETEERMALDYLAGVDILVSFRDCYPDNKLPDNKARYKAKQILKRERVQQYIEHVRSRGDLTEQINEVSIKSYLWDVAQKNKGSQVGLRAALALGKEFGIGTETLVVKEEKSYDLILHALHDFNDALARGENPEVPSILLDDQSGADVNDFIVADYEEITDDEE